MSPQLFSNPFDKGSSSDAPKGNSESKDITKPTAGGGSEDDILKLLNDDSDVKDKDDKDKKDVKEEKVKDDEEDDEKETKEDDEDKNDNDEDEDDDEKVELKEDEDDEDKKEDKKLDLKDKDDLDVPPKKRDILSKYPKFFEEFPFFDKMMFRDKAYTEMFGSFDEAKATFEKVERLNEFEDQLLSGDIRDVLSTVKDTDPKAYNKIVDNLLIQLNEIDKEAYSDTVSNLAKTIIIGMGNEAARKKDTDLDKAARRLYEYLFDEELKTDDQLKTKNRVKVEKSEEEDKVAKERAELQRERFESARDTLTVKIDNTLKATIAEYIDPKEQMTPYEKKNAIESALKALHSKVASDSAFRKILDKHWKASFESKFSAPSLENIKKSYLGKARGVAMSVIKEVRAEVLKDNRSNKGKEKEKEETTPQTRKNVNAGRPHQQTVKADERKPGESIEEFLAR